ncbi:MAG: putative DNA binding domain-containing protein [Clostridia bacterium]
MECKVTLEKEKPKSWLKSVSAFSNGIGGIIYFGVDKNNKYTGIDDPQKTIEKISEFIKTRIEPTPRFYISAIKIEDKDIIKVEVDSGARTPYYYNGDGAKTAYVRMGEQSVNCPEHMLNELILKGTRSSFDADISQENFKDLSFTLLKATYKQNTRNDFNEDKDYISFGLVTEDNKVTYAGILFADQCKLLQSRIFCTRWNGLNKASGLVDAVDDAECSGNLIYLRQAGFDFIKKHNKKAWRKTVNGRINYPEYNDDAILEALTNALIHRQYNSMGSEVHIDIFDDRLEIVSPRWNV